jgi:hypothetical protein
VDPSPFLIICPSAIEMAKWFELWKFKFEFLKAYVLLNMFLSGPKGAFLPL